MNLFKNRAPEEKEEIKQIIKLCFIAVIAFYIAITSFVYSCNHDDKTLMQVFKHIPKSVILDFE